MGYANHLKRLAAAAIDFGILWAFTWLVPVIIASSSSLTRPELSKITLILMLISFLYFPLFECSKWQGSPGKRVMKLKVTDLSGNKIGIGTAIGRLLGRLVDLLSYGVGIVMLLWTKKRQCLHDKIASTLVVSAETDSSFFELEGDIVIGKSVNGKIAELENLMNSGILSKEEFEKAVKQL